MDSIAKKPDGHLSNGAHDCQINDQHALANRMNALDCQDGMDKDKNNDRQDEKSRREP